MKIMFRSRKHAERETEYGNVSQLVFNILGSFKVQILEDSTSINMLSMFTWE